MALTAGTRLGSYEIVALIGEGGMGQVYRARDPRLGRDVALKVLPELFAADPERLARFKREAHVLASLNHPHIAGIHGFEEDAITVSGSPGPSRVEGSQTAHALVLELVEGSTLADRIARGALPIEEALPIARQIAEALEAAHEHGIVHRDLKPSNIKVRDDGNVKVLDFGLAKAFEDEVAAAGAGRSVAPTITSPAGTRLGVILGTAAYMSPEQARGKIVDRRADIWAFGCVLYEMLTGRRTFGGDEVSDTLAAVLRAVPEWDALPSVVPASVRHLLHRCLDRSIQRRLQHIGEARIILENVTSGAEQTDAGIARPARRRITVAAAAWLLTAVATGVTATLALRALNSTQSPPNLEQAIRFSVALPESWSLPDLALPGIGAPMPLAVSPDGQQMAFLAIGQKGRSQIWLRRLDALTAQLLNGTEGALRPFWSPDSRSIAFFADGKLKRIDLSGGVALTLCDAAAGNRGGTWSKDGIIVFAPTAASTLQKVSAAGGVPSAATTLGPGEVAHYAPVFLPDGLHFLYSATTDLTATTSSTTAIGPYKIYVGSLDSSERTMVLETDSMNVGHSRNHLLFARGTTLVAQPFDDERLMLAGDAFPLADQIHTTGGFAFFSVGSGVLSYRTGSANTSTRLVWFDRTGKELGTLGDPAPYSFVKLSPDGKRVSVRVLDATRGTGDIWLYDITRGLRNRFTFDPADELRSHWSPDGSRIVFNSRRKGRYDLYVKPSSGAGAEELFFEDEFEKQPLGWSSDGRSILFFSPRPKTGNDLFTVPIAGDHKAVPFVQTPRLDNSSTFSPDARWIAYASNESGRFEIYVAPFPGPGGKWQISPGGGDWPRWSRSGEIYYVAPDERTIMAVSVNGTGSSFEVGPAKALFEAPRTVAYHYDATSDGQRFLIIRPEQATQIPITVVTNWTAGVKR